MDARMSIRGGCHCGNIRYALEWPGTPGEPIPARACDCSFCRAHGAVWTSHPDALLEVRIADPAARRDYRFGTATANFHVCARCGVVPIVSCRVDGALLAVVNVNSFEEPARSLVAPAPASFEAEELSARLARRQRNWIGRVRMEEWGG